MSYGGSGGGGGSIATGNDVALSSPLDSQYLGYNNALQKWQNYPRPLQLTESVYTSGASGSAKTLADTSSYTIHNITLTANCVFTFPTAVAGKSFMLVLNQDATGSRTVTWPGSVKWPSATAPTLTTTASKTDVFSFICVDGSSWLGFTAGKTY